MNPGQLLRAVRAFLRAEWATLSEVDVPVYRRLWLYRRGFLSARDAVWDLTEESVDAYLTDRECRRLDQIGGPYGTALDNKLLFHLLVERTHEHLLPTVHGLVRDGEVIDVDRFETLDSTATLLERLRDEAFVLKPISGAKGDGVTLLETRDGEILIDGRPSSAEAVRRTLRRTRDSIVTERVEQADYAAEIHPASTNTLRVLTMVDPETAEPFLARATHRFGTASSGHVDNWSAGGLSAPVDAESGELGRAVWHPPEAETVRWVDVHPDTGVPIAGTDVPSWDRIRAAVLDLATTYGWAWPHAGWDVVVGADERVVTVLEGEKRSVDLDQQAHRPFLADERVRRFYDHHGVLDGTRGVIDG